MPRTRRTPEEEAMVAAAGPEFLEATARSLRIFTLFGANSRRMTLSEVARTLDLSRATVRRTLHTLCALGYLDLEGNTFGLTPKVLTFAASYLSSDIVPTVMQPIIDRLSVASGEACAAAVMEGDRVVLVSRASPPRTLSSDLRIGYSLPAYCTALGRVLLGGVEDAMLRAILDRLDPVPLTPFTLSDKDALFDRIVADRRHGYSFVDQEAELGLRSIAVPVRQADGRLRCAVHVGVHTELATAEEMRGRFLPLLRAVAEEAGTMLV